jgi:Domain of unknown function (DUF222)
MENVAQQLRSSANDVANLGSTAAEIGALDDAALLAAQQAISAHRRTLDTYSIWVAGEIGQRSRRDLGLTGLAQRTGFLSPEALIQSVSQSTRAEANKYVQVGLMVAELATSVESVAGSADVAIGAPWLAPVAAALAAGIMSADSAAAIRRGIGVADKGVSAQQLLAACGVLVGEASTRNADEIFRRARSLRDELDEAGITAREKERRDQRFLKYYRQPDGMYRGSFLLDPEDGGLLASAFDTVLSPRRGGPRFVDPEAQAKADELLADERSNEQIAADALVAMIRLAIGADSGTVFGSRRPAVRVIVQADVLAGKTGHGNIDGQPDPISLETVERHICDTGIIGVKFDDDGQCINVGREKRLFTGRQRVGLGVRDGGCRWVDCDRPASWCEAHHINQWARDHGKTDMADGVLLCRRHHILLHDNHWQIQRTGGTYWLKPPRAIDPKQQPIEMPSKSPPVQRMLAQRMRA